MALTTKRIIALPSQTDPQEGDYLAIDNATGGTHKIPAGRIGVEVDDTLSVSGKAADAKATGDAIDELRTQIEVTGTASGAIATFTDGAAMPAKSVIVNIEPKQSGTGTPSPDNVRQISGWESVVLGQSGKNLSPQTAYEMKLESNVPYIINSNITSPYTTTADYAGAGFTAQVEAGTAYVLSSDVSYSTSTTILWAIYNSLEDATNHANKIESGATYHTFTPTHSGVLVYMRYHSTTGSIATWTWNQCEKGTTATAFEPYQGTTTPVNLGRTVYGGTLDVVTGVLTAYPFYPSYNGETLDGRWICDRAVYAEGTTPPTGSQVALISGTSTTYQLTPTEIQTLLGENNVWADSGDVEVVYIRDLNIAINNLLNSNGTRSLGMMAMSAPTEATAEEPTDEPAEDDMR